MHDAEMISVSQWGMFPVATPDGVGFNAIASVLAFYGEATVQEFATDAGRAANYIRSLYDPLVFDMTPVRRFVVNEEIPGLRVGEQFNFEISGEVVPVIVVSMTWSISTGFNYVVEEWKHYAKFKI